MFLRRDKPQRKKPERHPGKPRKTQQKEKELHKEGGIIKNTNHQDIKKKKIILREGERHDAKSKGDIPARYNLDTPAISASFFIIIFVSRLLLLS